MQVQLYSEFLLVVPEAFLVVLLVLSQAQAAAVECVWLDLCFWPGWRNEISAHQHFEKVSLRKGGALSFLSRRSALESSQFSLYLSFFCTQRSLLRSLDFCVLTRIFLRAFN